MKITKKFGILMLLFALMIFTLLGCGIQSTALSSSQTGKTDLNETSTEQSEDKDGLESQDGEKREVIDELWEKLDGVWNFEEYTYMGRSTRNDKYTLEFQYIDNTPCIVKTTPQKDESIVKETFVYESSADDEYHYKAYVYKKDSYDGRPQSPYSQNDKLLFEWYEFDLTDISDGVLLISTNTSWVSQDSVDTHYYKYQKGN